MSLILPTGICCSWNATFGKAVNMLFWRTFFFVVESSLWVCTVTGGGFVMFTICVVIFCFCFCSICWTFSRHFCALHSGTSTDDISVVDEWCSDCTCSVFDTVSFWIMELISFIGTDCFFNFCFSRRLAALSSAFSRRASLFDASFTCFALCFDHVASPLVTNKHPTKSHVRCLYPDELTLPTKECSADHLDANKSRHLPSAKDTCGAFAKSSSYRTLKHNS